MIYPTARWLHFVVEPWPGCFRLRCWNCWNMAWVCLLYTWVVRLKPRHVVLQIFPPSGASLCDLPVPDAQSSWEIHPWWGRLGSRGYWNPPAPESHKACRQLWWLHWEEATSATTGKMTMVSQRWLLWKLRDHPSVAAAPQRESPELFAAAVELKITVLPMVSSL